MMGETKTETGWEFECAISIAIMFNAKLKSFQRALNTLIEGDGI